MAQNCWLFVLACGAGHQSFAARHAQGRELQGVTRARQAGRASPTYMVAVQKIAAGAMASERQALPAVPVLPTLHLRGKDFKSKRLWDAAVEDMLWQLNEPDFLVSDPSLSGIPRSPMR